MIMKLAIDGRKRYWCKFCQFSSTSKQSLRNHIRRNHDDPKNKLSCKVCDKSCINNSELKNHMLSHSILPQFSCTMCDQKFKSTGGMKNHYHSFHGKEGKYKCDFDDCVATFERRDMYIGHVNRHNGVRAYGCSFCERRFFSAKPLWVHEKRCKDSTTAAVGIERCHVCPTCGKGFITRQDLIQHKQMHGQAKFSCSKCQRQYKQKCNFYRHSKKCGAKVIVTE